MKKTVLVFAALIFSILLLFRLGEYSLITGNVTIEIIMAVVAFVFFGIGVVLNKNSLQQKKEIQPQPKVDFNKIEELEITNREYEVLQAVAKGLSNKEIAEKLFLSESTIKTHVSSLLLKLNAKRRTQAVQIAKELHIL
ncbi:MULTISPECIES: response regulator transcription factor [Mesonia]|uniref:Transcriptional regulatory protein DegU n=1 Tax=Mesonia oceanica TaxID=2687242 RepID=A0AC61Y4J5_9FLAO|nr:MULTISPECIES: response regulator transcription factor [Mesonia]MBJ98447.1 helix-turn-helix transcriptional regulator [Flavobacteriaceae bacterium]MAN26908.1 helix-turn-helix transcriptional regulator [Mesonia sp.]MAQ40742.1 helix-turn-helix transcriptional regulator [Mesonia sp.]MAQ41680.1 helix-turn-helix transcriptional regulator [Mesonia sp.]VVU99094.1 Transcriptional regulatory protein DegU [Mesonia oceanica]|tara:strand:+ start:267 stop:683 length:417 start_codon:yes stop_codon:yes gene_type:complete